MAISSSRVRNVESSLIQVPRKFKDREDEEEEEEETKLHKHKFNKTPNFNSHQKKKVAVVYYISRNGQLEHPHFMEVPLSSPQGLFLKDVINRLNILRGKGMASLYSWSSKRGYKNGFVWHDLTENDFIYPAHGHEYVLKGSELLLDPSSSSSSTNAGEPLLLEPKPSENHTSTEDFPVITRRRNQSWSSIDLNEYKVYKAEPFSESSRKLAADASTQTDDKRRRRRPVKEPEEIEELQEDNKSREEIEISPPPSDSSPETLESLMKADGRLILGSGNGNEDGLNPTVENCGRLKASTVLMQLISCGSVSFRDCGATPVRGQGLSLIGQYKARLPRGGGTTKDFSSFSGVRLEDKEYFSGSLIETKKESIPALKRSNSYNADRSVKVQMGAEKEEEGEEGARTRCIPRKSKGIIGSKKENNNMSLSSNNSQVGSKRFEVQQLQNDTV